jgi:hypothetical protein
LSCALGNVGIAGVDTLDHLTTIYSADAIN